MIINLLTLVIALTTWVTVNSAPVGSKLFSNNSDDYRLPRAVFPTVYTLSLTTYLPGYGWKADNRSETFEGFVIVDLEFREPTDRIVLHSESLSILDYNIRYDYDKAVTISEVELNPENQFLVLHLNTVVQANTSATIDITYRGKLGNELRGYYLTRSPGTDGELTRLNAVTQFETTAARFMVPCFDEPEFKATWRVAHKYPSGATALSNGVELSSTAVDEEWTRTFYKPTVKMSSYLLAIFVGDIQYEETVTNRGIRIRVYAPPAYIDKVSHALNVARIAVEGFEKQFDMNFPMEKIDFVAVKDFEAGAMENWGLIIHQNGALLGNSEYVAEVVIHELAHQWFGNLVTMDFWENSFLNEAFASYMTAAGLGFMYPDFDADYYNTKGDQAHGLAMDKENAIRDFDRDESNGNIRFGYVVYSKGSSFIRMIEKLAGKENFDCAIRWYLSENQYENVDEKDLYRAIQKFLPEDVLGPDGEKLDIGEFARCWTDQNSHPIIYVDKTDWGTIRLTQQRETRIASNKSVCGYRWDVPIWYQEVGRDVKLIWLGRDEFSVELKLEAPVIINANSNGFYRVSYSDNLLSEIAKALESNQTNFSDSTKFRLAEDVWMLPTSQGYNWDSVLRISAALYNDSKIEVREIIGNSYLTYKDKIREEKERLSADLEHFEEILPVGRLKLIGDCNGTLTFVECFGEGDNLVLHRIKEAENPGYSINRLLKYLETETNSLTRRKIWVLIYMSDRTALEKIIDENRYHLTKEEKNEIKTYLSGPSAPQKNSMQLGKKHSNPPQRYFPFAH